MSQFSNLPLQEMIADVVKSASDRMASRTDVVKSAMEEDICEACGHETKKCTCPPQEKEAGLTEHSYVMKLASACDFLASNIHNIEVPDRGVLGNALAKLAGEPVPPTNTAGALEATTGMAGKQQYKKDSAPPDQDAAKSEAGTSLKSPRPELGESATQLDNNVHSAPGQSSGAVPRATYPETGPLAKSAGLKGILSRIGTTGRKVDQAVTGAGGKALDAVGQGHRGLGAARAVGYGAPAALGAGALAASGGKEKSAAEIARQKILQKLAGEDVLKAAVSAPQSGGPSPGDGVMDALKAEDVPKNPTDGSGYGNQQRHMVGGNQAAIDYTKADAKKPRAKEIAEVLSVPAFSPKHDSKLREQLRNSGQAGVKIAGAKAKDFLKAAAAEGILTQATVDQFKVKVAMQKSAESGEGCKDDPVQKLKSLVNSKKEKESMGGMGGMMPPSGGM